MMEIVTSQGSSPRQAEEIKFQYSPCEFILGLFRARKSLVQTSSVLVDREKLFRILRQPFMDGI